MSCRRQRWAVAIMATVSVMFAGASASATVHHVSPEGSNTPPYATYETAANHPREALSLADTPGDTVLIHTGDYAIDTAMLVSNGVSVIGVSEDSVTLTWCCYHDEYVPLNIFFLLSNNTIRNITFVNPFGAGSQTVAAILTTTPLGHIAINECDFASVILAGTAADTLEVSNCFFDVDGGYGVYTQSGGGIVWVHDNFFWGGQGFKVPACVVAASTEVIVENNIFDLTGTNFRGVSIEVLNSHRPIVVRNNLMMGGDEGITWFGRQGLIENNTIVGTDPTVQGGIQIVNEPGYDIVVRNNILFKSTKPYIFECAGCSPSPKVEWLYNAYWPPVDSFFMLEDGSPGVVIIDSGNVNAYPMFVDDSLYHLQAGSPLIDAGDPSVLDAGGSRSDIGWTGGPGGVLPTYPEFPPLAPDSASATGTDGVVSLCWASRPEADLAGYNLYRGDESGFWISGLTPYRIFAPSDTCAADTILTAGESVNYVVTAFDTAGLESAASPEVSYTVTGVLDGPEGDLLPRSASILRAYPNPFNDATVIEFAVPVSAGSLHIDIFNVLGQRVDRVNLGHQDAGFHSVAWEAAVPSGVYFARLVSDDIAVGRTVKLVLLR